MELTNPKQQFAATAYVEAMIDNGDRDFEDYRDFCNGNIERIFVTTEERAKIQGLAIEYVLRTGLVEGDVKVFQLLLEDIKNYFLDLKETDSLGLGLTSDHYCAIAGVDKGRFEIEWYRTVAGDLPEDFPKVEIEALRELADGFKMLVFQEEVGRVATDFVKKLAQENATSLLETRPVKAFGVEFQVLNLDDMVWDLRADDAERLKNDVLVKIPQVAKICKDHGYVMGELPSFFAPPRPPMFEPTNTLEEAYEEFEKIALTADKVHITSMSADFTNRENPFPERQYPNVLIAALTWFSRDINGELVKEERAIQFTRADIWIKENQPN